jgi:tetrahydromethanopterin S-methyltransferase subunit G
MMDQSGQAHSLNSSSEGKPIIFLHLTKTAGGTLKTALGNTKNLSTFFVYGPHDINRLKERSPQDYDLIYGHSIFGLHKKVGLPDTTRYMCFMRHPLTRTISHYYHLRNVDRGPVGDRIRMSTDINDFFENYSHWEFSNFMVKIVSGMGNGRAPEGVSALQQAIQNIEKKFEFVGFQEFFSVSIQRLSQKIKRDLAIDNDVNVGRYAFGDVSKSTVKIIEDLNHGDMRLYKYALRKFL